MCAGGAGLPGIGKLLHEIREGLVGFAKPLTDLMMKDKNFTWGSEEKTTFKKLKEALTSALILQVFDENKPHEVWVDASDCAVGAMLV